MLPAATVFQVAKTVSAAAEISLQPDETELAVRNGSSHGGSDSITAAVDTFSSPGSAEIGNTYRLSSTLEFLSARFPAVLPFAVAFWFLGVGVFSLRFVGGVIEVRNLRTKNVEPLDGD